MPLLCVDSLVFYVQCLPIVHHSLDREQDQFGLIIYTALELSLDLISVHTMELDHTIVFILKMLVFNAQVSSLICKYFLQVNNTCRYTCPSS